VSGRTMELVMPIFEYVCKDCGKDFEALVSGEKKPHCPECDSAKLEQQYSAFAVGTTAGKGRFGKSATRQNGTCGDPRGPGSCATE